MSISGLQLLINMRPYITLPFNSESLSYAIGISTKANVVDQRRNTIRLLPGYQITIKVIPQLVGVTEQFKEMDMTSRNCRLASEIDGIKLTNTYSKIGCEFECATDKAIEICRCVPWYITNNFTGTPMCDSFGGHCFEEILTKESNYKQCSSKCMEDCSGMPMTMVTSYIPINTDEACKTDSYLEKHFIHSSRQHFTFEIYRSLIEGDGQIPDLETNMANGSLCRNFISKFVGIVIIESPTDSITKSARDVRITLIDQIGTIGGTLGLFTGMSILSLVEIVFFLVKFVKSFFNIEKSDLETVEKMVQGHQRTSQEPTMSADCKLTEEIGRNKEKIRQLEELVYLLLPEDKKHSIQIEAEIKTTLPASKHPKPQNFEIIDLEKNVDQIKVYTVVCTSQ